MKQNNKGIPTFLAYYYNLQGDEFAEFLDKANNDIPKALQLWADDLMITSAMIDDLSHKIGEYLEDNPDAKLTVMADLDSGEIIISCPQSIATPRKS